MQWPNQRVREQAEKRLKELIKQQREPTQRFYDEDRFKKAVPRGLTLGKQTLEKNLLIKTKAIKTGGLGRTSYSDEDSCS